MISLVIEKLCFANSFAKKVRVRLCLVQGNEKEWNENGNRMGMRMEWNGMIIPIPLFGKTNDQC